MIAKLAVAMASAPGGRGPPANVAALRHSLDQDNLRDAFQAMFPTG